MDILIRAPVGIAVGRMAAERGDARLGLAERRSGGHGSHYSGFALFLATRPLP